MRGRGQRAAGRGPRHARVATCGESAIRGGGWGRTRRSGRVGGHGRMPFGIPLCRHSLMSGVSVAEISFDGRVAIVTGAGGGLGRTYALELARRGASVVVNDLGGSVNGEGGSDAAAQKVVDEIKAAGGEAVANYDSVATPEGGENIVKSAVDAFGKVDVVINNAGILRDKSFAKMTLDDIHAVLDVHLKGAFYVSQPAFKVMKDNNYGRFVFTASNATFGNFGQTNYAAAKMGLVGLSNTIAVEGARNGILSNVIMPVARTR